MLGRPAEFETNYRWKHIVIMLSICVAGFITLVIELQISTETSRHILTTVAKSLLVGGLLGFLFEFALRRDILRMIFSIRDSIDVNKNWGDAASQIGLDAIYKSDRELDLESLIRNAVSLVIIMNDGRTWLYSHETHI
jgi:hypothetical protein